MATNPKVSAALEDAQGQLRCRMNSPQGCKFLLVWVRPQTLRALEYVTRKQAEGRAKRARPVTPEETASLALESWILESVQRFGFDLSDFRGGGPV